MDKNLENAKWILIFYSAKKGEKDGKHAKSIDLELFKNFLRNSKDNDFDMILELKDKEKSALKTVKFLLFGDLKSFHISLSL